jgi:hypothetical protein
MMRTTACTALRNVRHAVCARGFRLEGHLILPHPRVLARERHEAILTESSNAGVWIDRRVAGSFRVATSRMVRGSAVSGLLWRSTSRSAFGSVREGKNEEEALCSHQAGQNSTGVVGSLQEHKPRI